MSLRDEDPAIRMKLNYDLDKSQQIIILKQNMDNNTTKQARCQVEDGRTRVKEAEVCDGSEGYHQQHIGLEVRDQVHKVAVQGGTSDSETYF